MHVDPGEAKVETAELDELARTLSRSYGDALRAADGELAERIALQALAGGMSMAELYSRVITPAMWRIGDLWAKGAITIADEHLATALTNRVLASIFGSMPGDERKRGHLLLGAIEGQHHVLGLRMAADVLEEAGYEVDYLGGDVPLGDLAETVLTRDPDLLCMSITIPLGENLLEQALAALREARPSLPILLGGQAVSEDLGRHGVTIVKSLEALLPVVRSALAGSSRRKDDDELPEPHDARRAGLESPIWGMAPDTPEARLSRTVASTADIARRESRRARAYRRLAYEDPVSRLPTRRAFDDRIAELRQNPGARPLALIMLDLDEFKVVNDAGGHRAGDELLRRVGRAIERELREGDFAARFGGDEFVLLLPGTGPEQALEVAERLRAAIAERTEVTASIGVSQVGDDPRHSMLEADEALYAAKAGGRDNVRAAR
jgi:diguanylate cyclase (GGDEF)-like protein